METLANNLKVLMNSVEQISQKLANIEGKVDYNTKRLDEAIANLKVHVEEKLAVMDKKLQNLDDKIKSLETINTKERILADLYSKRYNLIIHGLPETDSNEDRNKSLQVVKNFLKEHLKIDSDITIIDAHRLRSNKTNESKVNYSRSPVKSRPLIFRLLNMFDKDLIMKNLTNLKPQDPSPTARQRIYVSQHLPAAMVKQKAALLGKFKQARRNNKHTRWGVDFNTANYCLFIDGDKVNATD